MKTRISLLTILIVTTLLATACNTATPTATLQPAPTDPPTNTAEPQPIQMPSGLWEGAQEAGDVDWSMSLDFDACTSTAPCARVYYIPCSGEFTFQKQDGSGLVFQENITEHPDQCFSGATVRAKYKGQDQPMILTWLGPDGSEGPTAELRYQDINAQPLFDGLGRQVDLFHLEAGGFNNFGSITAADGTLWIPDSGHGKVIRYDVASRTVAAEIQVGDPNSASFGDPQMVAVSEDSVWVTQCAEKKLARIDPSTNQIVDSIQLEVEPYAIILDGDAIWATSFESNQVLHIDTQTKQVVTISDIENPLGIAVGGGAAWVAEHRKGTLARIDPATNSVTERIQLPTGSTPENVISDDGSIWVANNFGNSISRIDPLTNAQMVIDLPQRGTNVSAGGGYIWVAMFPGADGEVDLSKYQLAKVDPQSNQIVKIFDFPGVSGSAFLDGILWINNRNDMSGDKIHAIQLAP